MSQNGTATTSTPAANKLVLQKYLNLAQPEHKILATYVWIDGSAENVRSRTITLEFEPHDVADLSWGTYDGSSTNQAETTNSEVFLKPVAIFRDPFLQGKNILVLCETYKFDKTPTLSNSRASCEKAMEEAKNTEPWFGIEQEYNLMDRDGWPFGCPQNDAQTVAYNLLPDKPNYCGVGADRALGRDIAEAHYKACLYAGVKISGINAEVLPSQWEFQVGPLTGIDAADHLWMGRYILHRVAEDFGVVVTFDPKPIPGNYDLAALDVNFSTRQMREDGGIEHIEKAIDRLSRRNQEHLASLRTKSGHDEISACLSECVANRSSGIRIPRLVYERKNGYLEDRRAASNCDPYTISEMIVRVAVLQ